MSEHSGQKIRDPLDRKCVTGESRGLRGTATESSSGRNAKVSLFHPVFASPVGATLRRSSVRPARAGRVESRDAKPGRKLYAHRVSGVDRKCVIRGGRNTRTTLIVVPL